MSSFWLKLFACIFMLIDHVGYVLFPNVAWLRIIGRLAFPIFAFQVSVGFDKTHHKEKYILRMVLFTVISQIPFYWMRKVVVSHPTPLLNVGATFTVALLALYCLDKIKKPWLKYLSVGFMILLSILIPMDYTWYGVLMVITFYWFRNNAFGIGIFYFILVVSYCHFRNSVFNLPALFALIPILFFNHQKGKNIKYFFYAFYPLHMILLILIKTYLNI